MDRLRFGTHSIPHSAQPHTREQGLRRSAELGLDANEVSFEYGVKMLEDPDIIRRVAEDLDVVLTCHGPYWINLNTIEKPKYYASKSHILQTVQMAAKIGAFSVTFHPAFYMGKTSEEVTPKVIEALKSVKEELTTPAELAVKISPELTGKPSQWGNLDELLEVASADKQFAFCIDFSHYHSRTGGLQNSYKEFAQTLQTIKDKAGPSYLKDLHVHVSGINYTHKGERNHLNLEKSDLKYKELMKALKDFDVKGVVICESPNLEEDAVLLKKIYKKL